MKLHINIAERIQYINLMPTGNLDEQMTGFDVIDKLEVTDAYIQKIKAYDPQDPANKEKPTKFLKKRPPGVFHYNVPSDDFTVELTKEECKVMVKMITLYAKKVVGDFPTPLVTLLRKIK